jgi:hypothetical protein
MTQRHTTAAHPKATNRKKDAARPQRDPREARVRTEKLPISSRLLRVREFAEQVTRKAPEKKSGKGKSRFVDPCHFGPQDKLALMQLLAEAGVGDDEGRQLFVTAVEYEVGGLRPALLKEIESQPAAEPVTVSQPPQSKADIELLQLGKAAAQLKTLLDNTRKTARTRLSQTLGETDPFGREHGPGYLEHVAVELGRISAACAVQPQEVATQPAPAPAVMGPEGRKLIKQMARIYDECLEADPRAGEARVLLDVLGLLRECTGLPIPCEGQAVRSILG